MDSKNSVNNMQSSNGGDEKYDSRTESIFSFLNHSFGSISNLPQLPSPQPPPPLFHYQQPTLFDSQAHNLRPFFFFKSREILAKTREILWKSKEIF